MANKSAPLKYPVNGEAIVVRGARHLACPKCGEVVLRFNDARALGSRALEIYRKKYGLLSDDDIRRMREHLGMTQAELATLLRLGKNTISRWESGRNVQTASLDLLLRCVRDVPGSLAFLRKQAA